MAQSRQALLLHPVRYRILQALNQANMTTQQITEQIGDVPQSTIYRHLRMLLTAEIIEVVETKEINGIIEKIYGVESQHNLSAEEFANLSKDDHIDNMELYAMSLMQSFDAAMHQMIDKDFDAMPITYREYAFYATEDEFLEIRRTIFRMLRDAEKKHDNREDDRKLYKVNISTYHDPR